MSKKTTKSAAPHAHNHEHDHGHEHDRSHDHGTGYERWDFPPAFIHPVGQHGTPSEQDAVDAKIESICGGIDDSQPVEQYDGTLGVTVAYVNAHQAPVGQLQWNNNLAAIYTNPGNVSDVRWCTGTLISCNLFLTAGHCFDQTGGGWSRPKINGTDDIIPSGEIATNMHVNFNYQVDADGNLKTEESFPIVELVEYRLNGLDYAIVRLGGNPGRKYGFTHVSPSDANINDMLCIIGHPAGVPKRIEAGPLTDLHGSYMGYSDIDTLGGNSGSGVLGPAGTIVGVHTNGGCNADYTGHNHGVRISSIIAASTVISNLLSTKQKFMDDGCQLVKFKVFDDRPKPVFRDHKPLQDARKPPAADLFKGIGDVKTAGYDLRPFRDPRILPSLAARRPGGAVGRTPFVLSTPHHAPGVGVGETGSIQDYLASMVQLLEERGRELAELQAALYELLSAYEEGGGGCGS